MLARDRRREEGRVFVPSCFCLQGGNVFLNGTLPGSTETPLPPPPLLPSWSLPKTRASNARVQAGRRGGVSPRVFSAQQRSWLGKEGGCAAMRKGEIALVDLKSFSLSTFGAITCHHPQYHWMGEGSVGRMERELDNMSVGSRPRNSLSGLCLVVGVACFTTIL